MPAPAPCGIVLDRDVLSLLGGRVLLGGDPGRLVRLSAPLTDGSPAARTLVDGGLAHPRPAPAVVRDVTVVIPVRDRADELARCLGALGRDVPVLVVDDASREPAAVAAVCRSHGARVLHLPVNSGPGAARNAGLAATSSELVAFLDSDCRPAADWLAVLLGHLADPRVAAVAPRVVAERGGGLLGRYAAARGPLDLGSRAALVRPGTRVAYVPTAALLVRRAALAAGFDPALRYGEDVDLVWRLHDAGWQVRYDPRTVVRHAEPTRWLPWLARRHAYGSSAAPLSRRHPGRLTPLVLSPWPAASVLLLCAGFPLPALAAAAVPTTRLVGRLRRMQVPRREAVRAAATLVARGLLGTAAGLGGAGTVTTGPVLLALLLPRRSRPAALGALLAPPLLDWCARRPAVDPLTWTVLRLADDLAYATGVWRGCLAARTLAPLRPRTTRPT